MVGGRPTGKILIRGARQLLTLRGARGPRRGADLNDLGIIRDGALLIRDGVIEEAGPTRRLENLAEARGAVEINAVGRVVMPGFVDSHTHLVFPPADTAPADQAAATRMIHACSAGLLAARAQTHLESMVRHGTTTVEVKSGCGPDEAADVKVLRALAGFRGIPVDVAPTFLMRLPDRTASREAERAAVARRISAELLPTLRRRGLAVCADLEWDPDPAIYPLFLQYMEAARLEGFARKIHDTGAAPSGSVLTAVENGALSIDHLERADTYELSLLARSSTVATLLPGTAFTSGGRFAPARALVDGGAAVALATNFNAQHTPILNMQMVVWLASTHMGLTAAEAISAATFNGAHALGRGDRVGSLERTKSADLIVLNIGDYQDLGKQVGTNLVHLTMKQGKFVYQEGRVAARKAEQLTTDN